MSLGTLNEPVSGKKEISEIYIPMDELLLTDIIQNM